MYFLQGELIRAIETTRAALVDLPGQEKYLYLCGRYNLARFLTESGQYREADEILQEDAELHREFPEPWAQLRLVWLRGKIEAGRGEWTAAEERFLAARAGFRGQRDAYDAAMVSLEISARGAPRRSGSSRKRWSPSSRSKTSRTTRFAPCASAPRRRSARS